LPESDAATSFVLNAFDSNTRRMASATAVPSMMAPSTMLSGGTGSVPNAATRYPLPDGFNSTAFTALDPISRPTTDRLLLNNPTISLLFSDRLRLHPGQGRCHLKQFEIRRNRRSLRRTRRKS